MKIKERQAECLMSLGAIQKSWWVGNEIGRLSISCYLGTEIYANSHII
jgi:hypothetical protein